MLTVKIIIDEINRLLVKNFPILKQVHINVCPNAFERPALLIECPRVTRRDVNRSTIKVTVYLTLTYYGIINARFISDTEELNAVQAAIMDIFKIGYISVEDRKLKAAGSEGYTGFDSTAVDVQLDYNDDRGNTAEIIPIAQTVTTKINQEG